MKLSEIIEEYEFGCSDVGDIKPYLRFTDSKGNFFLSRETPERGLLAAIIHRAFTDLELASTDRGDRRTAWEYVTHDGVEEWSFRWACEVLDLDYRIIREVCLRVFVESNKKHIEYLARVNEGNKRKREAGSSSTPVSMAQAPI